MMAKKSTGTWSLFLAGAALAFGVTTGLFEPARAQTPQVQAPQIIKSNIWDRADLMKFNFNRASAKFLNKNLARCLCASVPKADNPSACERLQPSDPVAAADTTKYPVDDCAQQNVPLDENLWKDRLYNAAGIELTGTYNLNGQKCGGADSSPTDLCPVQVRGFFDIQCSPGTTRCMVAKLVTAHYTIKQVIQVPGIMTMKPIRAEMPVPFEVATINTR